MIEALIVAVLGTVLGGLLARESSAWLIQLSRAVLDRGLRRLLQQWQGAARDRWQEEIEADFNTYSDRPLASLIFALRLRWATRRWTMRRFVALLVEPFRNRYDELSEEEKAERWRIALSSMGSANPMARAYKAAEAMERLRRESAMAGRECDEERQTSGGEVSRGQDLGKGK
jgi:hypothetical protein